jgi:hypothetical protein
MSNQWHGGKGDKQRKPSDSQQFADNWDRIFNKVASAAEDAADVMSDYDDGTDPVNEDPEPPFFRDPETGMLAIEFEDLFGKTNFELAGQFMRAFGQEVLTKPTLPEPSLAKLRLELIREEVEELNVGIEGMDIVEIADALPP